MTDPKQVHTVLATHQLADGYPMVLDLERSHGVWLHDSASGQEFMDFFTCFASWPIGYRHPMMEEQGFQSELALAATNNPANSDLYTTSMADFVEAFATRVTPADYPHHFWVAGGALAVENALKTAFDWKAHKVGIDKVNDGNDLVVMHFRQAFHGRSGYTMSLTNTDPTKVELFPKFDWPRVYNPAVHFDLDGKIDNDIEAEERRSIDEIKAAFAKYAGRVACVVIEPMQGEGGDNHFRSEFLQALRDLCDEHEALLVFDEVQTGFFGSGKPWLWQTKGVKPDVVSFGKKSQVCGIYTNTRIDDVPDNVFNRSSRINSTWGGNLVDMVRSKRFIEIIETEKLADNVAQQGDRFIAGLRALAKDRGGFDNVRGTGSLIAFDVADGATRDQLLGRMRDQQLLALPCGERSVRFRMPLIVSAEEIDRALEMIANALPAKVQA
jgi:L-lysine 6-transaminase